MKNNIDSSISLLSLIHTTTADFLIKELSKMGFDDFASSHGNILFQLSINEKMTMKDLSAKINRDKSTTTVLVRKLIKEGYVEECPSNTDGRSKFISLTQKGQQFQKITCDISAQLLNTFYDGFSEEEKKDFLNYLNRIYNNFTKSS